LDFANYRQRWAKRSYVQHAAYLNLFKYSEVRVNVAKLLLAA